jgi:hypothetical protein
LQVTLEQAENKASQHQQASNEIKKTGPKGQYQKKQRKSLKTQNNVGGQQNRGGGAKRTKADMKKKKNHSQATASGTREVKSVNKRRSELTNQTGTHRR